MKAKKDTIEAIVKDAAKFAFGDDAFVPEEHKGSPLYDIEFMIFLGDTISFSSGDIDKLNAKLVMNGLSLLFWQCGISRQVGLFIIICVMTPDKRMEALELIDKDDDAEPCSSETSVPVEEENFSYSFNKNEYDTDKKELEEAFGLAFGKKNREALEEDDDMYECQVYASAIIKMLKELGVGEDEVFVMTDRKKKRHSIDACVLGLSYKSYPERKDKTFEGFNYDGRYYLIEYFFKTEDLGYSNNMGFFQNSNYIQLDRLNLTEWQNYYRYIRTEFTKPASKRKVIKASYLDDLHKYM